MSGGTANHTGWFVRQARLMHLTTRLARRPQNSWAVPIRYFLQERPKRKVVEPTLYGLFTAKAGNQIQVIR